MYSGGINLKYHIHIHNISCTKYTMVHTEDTGESTLENIAHREQAEQQSTQEAGGDNEISGRRRAARPNDRWRNKNTHFISHITYKHTRVYTQNYRLNLRHWNWTIPGMIHNAGIIKYFQLWEPLKNEHVVNTNWYHNSSYGRRIWYMLIFCFWAWRQSNYSALFLALRDKDAWWYVWALATQSCKMLLARGGLGTRQAGWPTTQITMAGMNDLPDQPYNLACHDKSLWWHPPKYHPTNALSSMMKMVIVLRTLQPCELFHFYFCFEPKNRQKNKGVQKLLRLVTAVLALQIFFVRLEAENRQIEWVRFQIMS